MPAFENIPSNEMVPLFHAEVSNKAANIFQNAGRVLLIGTTQEAASAGKTFLATDEGQVKSKCGPASMCFDEFRIFRKGNTTTEVKILPILEPTGSTAEGAFTISGTATAAGILHSYINGVHYPLAVMEGDDEETQAAGLVALINADETCPMKAIDEGSGEVRLQAKFKGALYNDVPLEINVYGPDNNGDEELPAGVEVAISPMSGGTGSPDMAVAMAAVGDEEFDFICNPFADIAALNNMRDFMNDVAGRWSDEQQIYGHSFSMARVQSATIAQNFSIALNDPHLSYIPMQGMRQAPWLWNAALVAGLSKKWINHPSRPGQTTPLVGIIPPKPADLWNKSTRRTLLMSGSSSLVVVNGGVQVERMVTTYQRNKSGIADISYRNVNTMYQLMYIIRRLRSAITSKYPDFALADDGFQGNDDAVVTPSILKAEVVSAYNEMATQAPVIVENAPMFEAHLDIRRSKSDPDRVDAYIPPDLANQFRIFAALVEFRLNY